MSDDDRNWHPVTMEGHIFINQGHVDYILFKVDRESWNDQLERNGFDPDDYDFHLKYLHLTPKKSVAS